MRIICEYPDVYNSGNPSHTDCGGFPGNIECANSFVNGLTNSLAHRCEAYVPIVDTLYWQPDGTVHIFDLSGFMVGFACITMCYFIGLPLKVVTRFFRGTTRL